MELVEKTPLKMVLRIEMSHSLANAIRRSVEEVSALAIDEVEFFKNDSALYDEVLAHRIGLIPLKTEGKMSAKTSVDFSLKKTGPCVVYSGDMKGGANVVYDNIPITILEEGQSIELSANARLGNGLEHAKYVPGLSYYRHLLEVKSDPKIDKIIEENPGLVKPEKKGSKWICDLKEAVVHEIEKIDSEAVKDSNEILFVVESWGHLDAEVIFKKSVETLSGNLDLFEKALK